MTQTRDRCFDLSKSKITAFEQRPKKLWLATHRPEVAEKDEGAAARFATGNAVGEIVCAHHPGGVMVDPPSLCEALAKTSSLIADGHQGVRTARDVLAPLCLGDGSRGSSDRTIARDGALKSPELWRFPLTDSRCVRKSELASSV
ncbi:hypothetical protein FHS52_001197 [Erythromicrobium ramosum]|uniref:Uncharacterized protein n=1 Tax=Erythrobacter ramosus TaxID=35811 RepID=A0ABR6HXA3_9SPHN|nr:hypothetical protein [Erythrobacter ramosus]MBB3775254.1 hypothetical protein [Erythrobacter ramosus]